MKQKLRNIKCCEAQYLFLQVYSPSILLPVALTAFSEDFFGVFLFLSYIPLWPLYR
jgi:hypothetical protein